MSEREAVLLICWFVTMFVALYLIGPGKRGRGGSDHEYDEAAEAADREAAASYARIPPSAADCDEDFTRGYWIGYRHAVELSKNARSVAEIQRILDEAQA